MDAYDFLIEAQANDDIHIDIWTEHYCDTKYGILIGNISVAKDLDLNDVNSFLEDWENFEKSTFIIFPPNFVRQYTRNTLKEKYRDMDPLPFIKAVYRSASEVPEYIVEELPELFKYVIRPVAYNTSVLVFADET